KRPDTLMQLSRSSLSEIRLAPRGRAWHKADIPRLTAFCLLSEQLKRRSNSARIFARSKVAVRWTALTASGDRIRAALLRLLASGFGRFCCRSRRRRKRPLAPSYRLSLPLARESGGWGLL